MPVFNLDGVRPGQLRMTGALLTEIYQGRIVNWNDPAIAAKNPGLLLARYEDRGRPSERQLWHHVQLEPRYSSCMASAAIETRSQALFAERIDYEIDERTRPERQLLLVWVIEADRPDIRVPAGQQPDEVAAEQPA